MSRPPKGPRAMTPAERKAASRAKAKAVPPPAAPPATVTAPKRKPPASPPPAPVVAKAIPVTKAGAPPPIGETLAEHEHLTAALKVRAGKADASGQDIANYQRALERLTELRDEGGSRMTEAGWMRSVTTKRLQALLVEALKLYPEALRAAAEAFERAGSGQ